MFEIEFTFIEQVPRKQNSNVDALPRLAATKQADALNVVLVEFLESPSIVAGTIEVEMIDIKPT